MSSVLPPSAPPLRSQRVFLRASLRSLNSDLVGLVDEWGKRFVDELDYTKEAASGSQFSEAMRKRGLDRVMAAEVVSELTTRRVLTTEWVEGRRIDDPALGAESVDLSVQLAVAAYLTMLLDTGELHADPHPGNLLITPDGKLCILDFGLVTSVTRAQQYAILQYVAHLVGRDYASVPGDLVAMGFVPDAKRQALEDSGVVQVLADVFRALAKGGGVKVVSNNLSKIGKDGDGAAAEAAEEPPPLTSTGLPRERTTKVGTLARDISYIQRKYDNILQIPTYFAYILRSFSVLEGIGLSADPQYSIANACYPYVARRCVRSARREPPHLFLHLATPSATAGTDPHTRPPEPTPRRRPQAPHRPVPGGAVGAGGDPVRPSGARGAAGREARGADRHGVQHVHGGDRVLERVRRKRRRRALSFFLAGGLRKGPNRPEPSKLAPLSLAGPARP